MGLINDEIIMSKPHPTTDTNADDTDSHHRTESPTDTCSVCDESVEEPDQKLVLETTDDIGLVSTRVTRQLCADCWTDLYQRTTSNSPPH